MLLIHSKEDREGGNTNRKKKTEFLVCCQSMCPPMISAQGEEAQISSKTGRGEDTSPFVACFQIPVNTACLLMK
jgi:hypothetical protein